MLRCWRLTFTVLAASARTSQLFELSVVSHFSCFFCQPYNTFNTIFRFLLDGFKFHLVGFYFMFHHNFKLFLCDRCILKTFYNYQPIFLPVQTFAFSCILWGYSSGSFSSCCSSPASFSFRCCSSTFFSSATSFSTGSYIHFVPFFSYSTTPMLRR